MNNETAGNKIVAALLKQCGGTAQFTHAELQALGNYEFLCAYKGDIFVMQLVAQSTESEEKIKAAQVTSHVKQTKLRSSFDTLKSRLGWFLKKKPR